jgi:hypothetical protein
MNNSRISRGIAVGTMLTLIASAAAADATVEQKTQVQFTGAVGAMVNVFGGKAAREGLTSTSAVHGNRKATTTGSNQEIVDLDQEKVYHLDLDRRTYRVETFEEIRKRFEEQRDRSANREEKSSKHDGPEYEIDVNVKSTGQKQQLNGWDTHEELVTITLHEKGKTVDQAGGAIMTADIWMGPRVAAMHELADFDRRYFQKLYGSMYSGAEMAQAAMLMATTPAFAKAMKAFSDKRAAFNGTPIRTTLTFESVAAPGSSNAESNEDNSSPSAMIGGLLRKAKARREQSKGDQQPNHSTLFTSTSDVLHASTTAGAESVAIPAGFKSK